jgi:hypothetical protein
MPQAVTMEMNGGIIVLKQSFNFYETLFPASKLALHFLENYYVDNKSPDGEPGQEVNRSFLYL